VDNSLGDFYCLAAHAKHLRSATYILPQTSHVLNLVFFLGISYDEIN